MTTFLPAEKGTPIRVPSTANLMIDSQDRDTNNYLYTANFQINKPQSILNGFFTRIGATEHVLEWQYPNINGDLNNTSIEVDVSGGTQIASLTAGFYTVEEALTALVNKLNTVGTVPGVVWALTTTTSGFRSITCNAQFTVKDTPLANQLMPGEDYPETFPSGTGGGWFIIFPDLRPFRYIDFVSEQLTYNQELKDAATTTADRNVLLRWYMAFDQPPALDGFGYPILMGYNAFVLRRIFNPPKQIRWDPQQPLGNIAFSAYIDEQSALRIGLTDERFPVGAYGGTWDYLLTLQVSEV